MSSKLFADAFEADPTQSYHTDAQIVQQCLGGDQEAWRVLLEKYRRLIYSIPAKYGVSPEDAADIFQTVALDIFSDLPKLREPKALRAWLIQVTMRKCLQWKEAQLRRAEDDLRKVELNPPESLIVAPVLLEEAELDQQLHEAVSLLPPRFRKLVRMLFFDQPAPSYKEIAESLGLARGSIPFLRARCLKRLQQILQEMDSESPITRIR